MITETQEIKLNLSKTLVEVEDEIKNIEELVNSYKNILNSLSLDKERCLNYLYKGAKQIFLLGGRINHKTEQLYHKTASIYIEETHQGESFPQG